MSNIVEQSPSLGVNISSVTQVFPGVLWNPEVRYHFRNGRPLVLILPKINPIHKLPSNLFNFRFNIIISSLSHFSIVVHTPFLLIVFCLIILITRVDEYKLCLLIAPKTYTLTFSCTSLTIPFSNTSVYEVCPRFNVRSQVSPPCKK
jgi:hypothetical protein